LADTQRSAEAEVYDAVEGSALRGLYHRNSITIVDEDEIAVRLARLQHRVNAGSRTRIGRMLRLNRPSRLLLAGRDYSPNRRRAFDGRTAFEPTEEPVSVDCGSPLATPGS